MDAVSHLVLDIQDTFSKNRYLTCLFLDIKGAYDSVDLDVLQCKLNNHKLSKKAAANTVELFRDRQVFIRDHKGQLHGPALTKRGLAQGSVLSPILFNVYTSDLHKLKNDTINIIQYADDICIYTIQDTFSEAVRETRKVVGTLKKWMDDNNFTISAEKSAFLVFTRHRLQKRDWLGCGDYRIPWVRCYKYLGVF